MRHTILCIVVLCFLSNILKISILFVILSENIIVYVYESISKIIRSNYIKIRSSSFYYYNICI